MTISDADITQRLEVRRAEIAAMSDTIEQALSLHALQLEIDVRAGVRGAASELVKVKRELDSYLSGRTAQASASFATLAEAARWIIAQGYLVTDRTVHNHASKPGFPHKQKDGSYLRSQIEKYASETWENPGRGEKSPDALENSGLDVKRETARKLKLANDEKEGALIARSLVEQELSARLAFLKRDLMNLGPRAIDTMLERFTVLAREQGLDLDGVNLISLIPDLEDFWQKSMAGYLDSYARPRDFLPADINMSAAGEAE